MGVVGKARRQLERRRDEPVDYWRYQAVSQTLGDERFRLTALRRGPRVDLRLDEVTSSFNWADEGSELSGSLSLEAAPDRMALYEGDKVRCEFAPGANAPFVHLWTMELGAVEKKAPWGWTLPLASTMTVVRETKEDFKFKKDKRHPKGWTADQVTREVARISGFRIKVVARGTHRIKNLKQKNADPIDVIVKAYKAEREATGRRFFVQWNGALSIVPLQRSRHLLELSGAVIEASYGEERRKDFATELVVKATVKNGTRKKKKLSVRVRSSEGVRRYGVVTEEVESKDLETEAQLRRYARESLARRIKPKQTLSLSLPILPTLRRGDAFTINWAGFGIKQVVFVAGATHTVSSGDRTTQITARLDDPYVDVQAGIDYARKVAKARKKGRPVKADDPNALASTGGTVLKFPTPRNGKRRSDSDSYAVKGGRAA